MISDSELSNDFSLDTVGSHGDVKCKGRYKDYLVRFCHRHKFIHNNCDISFIKEPDVLDGV